MATATTTITTLTPDAEEILATMLDTFAEWDAQPTTEVYATETPDRELSTGSAVYSGQYM